MFVVEVGSVLTTLLWVRDIVAHRPDQPPLWFTGAGQRLAVVHRGVRQLRRGGRRGARQGAGGALRKMRKDTKAREAVEGGKEERGLGLDPAQGRPGRGARPGSSSPATARSSRASPRSTSRRSPANRRRSSARAAATGRAVTGGTKVLSDRIVVRISANPGESFLDRMIALVEGASRQKTPNEIALHILLVGLTLVFLFACVTLVPLALYSGVAPLRDGHRGAAGVPHPDHHRRAALGHRHRRHGPAACART